MINWIKDLFTNRPDVKEPIDMVADEPELWTYNSVDLHWFDDWENRKLVGWRTTKPKEGDIFQAPMESGKTAWFVFTNIKRCGDPHDMFFATVADLGYKGDLEDKIELSEPGIRLL